ncbi:MAG: sensor histidine kinase FleS [Candidatus Pelagadaptatus aseana]|uniref:sensor histidine kinase n=1 Tax=Candidatus Pelagadaptatus aseana TaxID=3120508 RepID=UPI0039B1A9BA
MALAAALPETEAVRLHEDHSNDRNMADVRSAFAAFRKMSQQLSDSYEVLEERVADLTEELNTVSHQRMEELAEKERIADRLENLLSVLPGGVVVIDATGRVSEANMAAKEMLGEPLEGELWRDVIQRNFCPREDDGHEISTRDGRRYSLSTRSLAEDGQIILLTDQTETRRLQGELSRHERLSALGQMVSALAHQIRTPLSAAMLYAGHLCGGALSPAQQQRFSEKLMKRLNHMERHVQDMLTFVKGELPLHDLVTAGELQGALNEEMEMVLKTSHAACHWDNQVSGQLLRCHKDALIGALLNLVNNAVQSQAEGVELQIQMAPCGDEAVAIEVRDNGPGMPADELSKAKEVFVTSKPQGTGLGLAVVESVVRRHGGTFELQSEVGVGTCARVLLPLAQFAPTQTKTDGV